MPTHQGQTQTDIVLGDGGSGVTEHAALSWTLTAGAVALAVEERSDATNVDVATAITVLDAAGGAVGEVHTQLTAAAEPDGATELTRSRTDEYPALPATDPSWPSAPDTVASRDWSADAVGLGALTACFEVATTAAPGVTVAQLVLAQSPDQLQIQLTFTSGRSTLATAVVTCDATALGAGTPVVDDQFQS